MGKLFLSNRSDTTSLLKKASGKIVKIASISCNGFWVSFLWEGFSHQIGVLQLLYYSKVKVVKIAIISYNRFFGSFLWEGFSRQIEVLQLLYYSKVKGVKIATISCTVLNRNPSPSATTCEAYRREPRFARQHPPAARCAPRPSVRPRPRWPRRSQRPALHGPSASDAHLKVPCKTSQTFSETSASMASEAAEAGLIPPMP